MDCATCLDAYLNHLGGDCNFGSGILVFWGLKQVLEVLSLLLLFGFGLKALKFCWNYKGLARFFYDIRGKSGPLRNGFCTKSDFDRKRTSKISSCKVQNLSPTEIDKLEKTEFVNCDADADADCRAKTVLSQDCNNDTYDCNEEGLEDYYEDDEFDVLALRKLVKIERRRAHSASLELEKERMSAATAAEETMAMILRLQNEKSLIEMEANQYRRLAEEKQLHDQEVIQSLQWLVLKRESERTVLEDQLRLYQEIIKAVHAE